MTKAPQRLKLSIIFKRSPSKFIVSFSSPVFFALVSLVLMYKPAVLLYPLILLRNFHFKNRLCEQSYVFRISDVDLLPTDHNDDASPILECSSLDVFGVSVKPSRQLYPSSSPASKNSKLIRISCFGSKRVLMSFIVFS